jgi:hypothetical protein
MNVNHTPGNSVITDSDGVDELAVASSLLSKSLQ